jgi:2-iminobutanoate/2-iminopropanoate deaminase
MTCRLKSYWHNRFALNTVWIYDFPAQMTRMITASSLGLEHLNSSEFARTGLPFSEMVRVGEMLYLSGQMGTLPGTLTLIEGGMAAQARQALQNIEHALQTQGYSLQHVVKCTVMLADMDDWPDFNTVYREFFRAPYPARSAFGVTALALGGMLEIDVIATTGKSASATL